MLPSKSPDLEISRIYREILNGIILQAFNADQGREILLALAQTLQQRLEGRRDIPCMRGLDRTLRGGVALMKASHESPINLHAADVLFAEGAAFLREDMTDLRRVLIAA